MSDINGVMMQYFHWYLKADGQLWKQTQASAQELADSGLTAIWLPPAYKGIGGLNDVGYGVYDMYDLGEFDQKGSVITKYGSKDEYLAAIKSLHDAGLQVYADAVLNHRMGADEAEDAPATPYYTNNRLNPKGGQKNIRAYTKFTFPGRGDACSLFKWNWRHFDAVDYNEYEPNERSTVYLFEGKNFDDYVALENGNFAYLMGCDIDFQSVEVQKEITDWGKWYLDTTGADGFRLDAIKHISSWFFPLWIDALEKHTGRKLFIVGEYWVPDLNTLSWYINATGGRISVFDVPLHFNFHYASRSGGSYDMRGIFDGSLMKSMPYSAVTFVENHDSQPLQALESVVDPWFKSLAYAIILLRSEGYPCIFYADYYGAEYDDRGRDGNPYHIYMPSHKEIIDKFLFARKHFCYGPQYDYFDNCNIIGWTRLGNENHPDPLAVIMSNGSGGSKWMEVGGKLMEFYDITGNIHEITTTNEHGWGEFRCSGGSVSVWIKK